MGSGEPLDDFKVRDSGLSKLWKGHFGAVWDQKLMPLQFGGNAQALQGWNHSLLDSEGGLERILSFRKR